MEKNYCNKCGNCCKKIAVDFNTQTLYRDGVEKLTEEFSKLLIPYARKVNITFCRCKFLEGNTCTNSQKPECCTNFPSSPFAFLPDECGYEGLIFNKKEHIKQKIRKLKEEIIDYEIQLTHDKSLQKIINHHKAFINKYKVYGSYDW